jgi:micrococcal nuclease
MYEYKARVVRVIDGDTVDVDIDLGFGIWMNNERVRIMGIDTPESRTRDKIEKVFGLAAKEKLINLLGTYCRLKTQVAKNGEDMKGKFGRILGDFEVYDHQKDAYRSVSKILVEEGYAVEYDGGNKDSMDLLHLANRKRLIDEGKVDIKLHNIVNP